MKLEKYDNDLLIKIANKSATARLCELTNKPLMLGAYFVIDGMSVVHSESVVNDYCIKHYGESYNTLSIEDSDNFYYSENEDSEQFLDEIKEQDYYYNSLSLIVEYGLSEEENNERLRLLQVLKANNKNGIFLDSECIKETNYITTLAHAKELYNDYF